MTLHVVYRSCGGENRKNRPVFYSKALALASFVRASAATGVPSDIVFLNDGPIPDDRLRLQRRAGEVRTVRAGSNRRSYRAAIALPRIRGWHRGDLVWFAEDDYLYQEDALASLVAAANRLPQASYFALYGSMRHAGHTATRHVRVASQPRSLGDPAAVPVGTRRYYRAVATTSTFWGRVGAVVDDERLLRLCSRSAGSWDTTTCLCLQGQQPFRWRRLAADLARPGSGDPARRAARGAVGAAMNVRSLVRRPALRRVLVAADPEPVTHLEEPLLAPGTDWAALARDTAAWASTGGLEIE